MVTRAPPHLNPRALGPPDRRSARRVASPDVKTLHHFGLRKRAVGHLYRIPKKIPNSPDQAIVALAREQHRNVTRRQLLAFGLSSAAIHRRAQAGRLHQVHVGVYAVGTPPNTALERAAAAVLACGEGAALSHGSALKLWGLAKEWEFPVHVTAPGDRRPARIAVHQSALTPDEVRTHWGILITSPARTLLDCAPILPPEERTRAVNEALRSPYMSEGQLADICRNHTNHPGRRLLLSFVETPTGPTRSEFENAFVRFCRRFGFPHPQVNSRVHGYEVDAYFPNEGLIVELDGWAFHRFRASFESDRDRDADLLVAGLVTVRITWERLTQRPHEEAQRLHAIFARRRAALT